MSDESYTHCSLSQMQADDADDLLLLCEEEGIEEAVQQLRLTSKEDAVVYKLRGGEAHIKVRELRSEGLSFQIWPAAHALCWYLEQTFGQTGMLSTRPSDLPTSKKHSLHQNLRVLELGAGTGMVGILCAVLGAHSTITDLPHVIANLEHNANLNQDVIESSGLGGSVVVKMLRWGERADVDAIGCSFDLIVASDVVYYDHLFEPLLCTLKWLLLPPSCSKQCMGMSFEGIEAKTGKELPRTNEECTSSNDVQEGGTSSYLPTTKETVLKPCDVGNAIPITNAASIALNMTKEAAGEETPRRVLLAHLRRWKKDSHFFKKASKLFQVTVVHKHSHDANSRTGVTVYSFSKKRN